MHVFLFRCSNCRRLLFSSNFSKLYSTQQKVADSSHSLPCSTMLRKVVLIANYLLGASNCIASSQYFAVCCLNECEGIVNHFEAQTLESGSEKTTTWNFSVWWNDMMAWDNFSNNLVFLENFNTRLLRLIISDSTPSAPRHRSKCQGLHWSRREKQVETSVITFDGIYYVPKYPTLIFISTEN